MKQNDTKWRAGDDFPAPEGGFPTWGIDRVQGGRKHGNAIEVYTSAEDRDTIVSALNRAVADEKQAPVPPGWVRLTRGDDGEAVLMRANRIEVVEPHRVIADDGVTIVTAGTKVWVPTDVLPFVTESPAEVAALIAAAEAAERRATALPVMAAVCDLAAAVRREDMPAMAAVMNAAAILDAIERREGE